MEKRSQANEPLANFFEEQVKFSKIPCDEIPQEINNFYQNQLDMSSTNWVEDIPPEPALKTKVNFSKKTYHSFYCLVMVF